MGGRIVAGTSTVLESVLPDVPLANPLSLAVDWDGRAIVGARIGGRRETRIGKLLQGRTTTEAVAAISRLFSVCRRSQRVAAAHACELAERGSADPSIARFGELEVLSEYALESLWRLLLDWPPLFGETPRESEFISIRARLLASLTAIDAAREEDDRGAGWIRVAADLERFLAASVFGVGLERWQAMGCEGWLADSDLPSARIVKGLRSQPSNGAACEPLPWLDAGRLREDIVPAMEASDDFESAPAWRGRPAETGALARRCVAGKFAGFARAQDNAARLACRLEELARIPARMRALAAGAGAHWVRGVEVERGAALAAVETARGTLLHFVRVAGGRIAHWRIAAPTEWNFHPSGAFVRALAGMPARSEEEARRAAQLAACALDPCVAYDIAVAHA